MSSFSKSYIKINTEENATYPQRSNQKIQLDQSRHQRLTMQFDLQYLVKLRKKTYKIGIPLAQSSNGVLCQSMFYPTIWSSH